MRRERKKAAKKLKSPSIQDSEDEGDNEGNNEETEGNKKRKTSEKLRINLKVPPTARGKTLKKKKESKVVKEMI